MESFECYFKHSISPFSMQDNFYHVFTNVLWTILLSFSCNQLIDIFQKVMFIEIPKEKVFLHFFSHFYFI